MEAAHQVANTETTTMRYLSSSNLSDIEISEYPDSNKNGIYGARSETEGPRKMFHGEVTLEYYDREPVQPEGRTQE